ncbi:hypothetical protein [Shimazuella kribbensis]|uniref:hypothetical protein n=1 Tax=Shimazuella kribbensis TaxID=139808 RepID=UPI00048D8500|nr:hypothetical protein [Shimazuella kribbensis]
MIWVRGQHITIDEALTTAVMKALGDPRLDIWMYGIETVEQALKDLAIWGVEGEFTFDHDDCEYIVIVDGETFYVMGLIYSAQERLAKYEERAEQYELELCG